VTLEAKTASVGHDSVTVVVCAFSLERFELTLACARSLLTQVPFPPDVVIVVDQNPELEQRLHEALGAAVRIVSNDGQRGLSSARNTGIGEATGSTIAFIDDDAVAAPDWLAGLQAALADPDVLAAGGHAIPVWSGHRPEHFPDEFLWVVGCSYRGLRRNGPVRNPLGCNMAFRARVFTEVGGFDPAIGRLGSRPLGCEETELCVRARRRFPKAQIVMVEDAVVEHAVPSSRQRFSYYWRRCLYEGASKALMRRLTDERALDTERRYASRTLPAAICRDLVRAIRLRGPRTALLRIGWVWAGLAAAIIGFAIGACYYAMHPPDDTRLYVAERPPGT
jgi:GT2 family glycosyltransferase